MLVDDDLYLETGAPETVKNRNLTANTSVVVHLDGDEDVVIVNGRAIPTRLDPVLGARLAAAFASKYDGYEPGPDNWSKGGLVRIDPDRVLAWREMPTATRWRFSAGQRR